MIHKKAFSAGGVIILFQVTGLEKSNLSYLGSHLNLFGHSVH